LIGQILYNLNVYSDALFKGSDEGKVRLGCKTCKEFCPLKKKRNRLLSCAIENDVSRMFPENSCVKAHDFSSGTNTIVW